VHVITVNIDGSGKNVKGKLFPCGVGVSVVDNGREVIALSHNAGLGTSNDAEWIAAALGFKAAVAYYESIGRPKKCKVYVKGDSKLVVNHFHCIWTCKKPEFYKMMKIAKRYRHELGSKFVSFTWIPREKNQRADYLAGKGRRKKNVTLTIN